MATLRQQQDGGYAFYFFINCKQKTTASSVYDFAVEDVRIHL
jgi:hypothetical protein